MGDACLGEIVLFCAMVSGATNGRVTLPAPGCPLLGLGCSPSVSSLPETHPLLLQRFHRARCFGLIEMNFSMGDPEILCAVASADAQLAVCKKSSFNPERGK
jgi:hypothetical protein